MAPSLLAADVLNFEKEVRAVEKAGADWHHFDVMDGHYVPNLSYGLPILKGIKKIANIPLDVHIMVSNPDEVAVSYVKAGADIIVFHYEAARHHHRIIQECKELGAMVGVALNPGTPISAVLPLLWDLDIVNIMTVNPGFGGQKFIPKCLEKIMALSEILQQKGLADRVRIQVDGGVNKETAKRVVDAGASILVAGSAIFGSPDLAKAITDIRGELRES